jgi:acetolactate synthase I/II/III large subunit
MSSRNPEASNADGGTAAPTDDRAGRMFTGGQIIVDALIREGVERVFAIPGHGNSSLLDAFVDRKDEIELVPAIHEQGAAHMADGYYRASGKLAAVCTSIGPGATNTLTGLATAFADSQPLLLITGAVHTYMENHGLLQEIDRPHGNNFPRMAEPVVKRWWQPSRVDQLPMVMSQAFNALYEGRRGPVLLDIPQDLQAEFAHYVPVEGKRRPSRNAVGVVSEIREAAKLLAGAKRPVVLAGGGVIAAGATDELLAVAEHIGAPVTHSYMGKGAVPADHDLYAWPCGNVGSIPGNTLTRSADVILAVGCRFGDRVASSYKHGVTFSIPDTKLVQIDIDGFEIGRNYPVEVGIVGDAKTTLAGLGEALEEIEPARAYRDSEYFAELVELRKQWDEHLASARASAERPILNSRALVEIREAFPREGILVTDSSNPANQSFNEFPVYGPKLNIVAGGMSGIGFGVPAAIGAQIARPDKPVLAIVGDGSFLQTATELCTAAMLNLPLVVVVLNNSGWQAIKDLQIRMFGDDREIITAFTKQGGEQFEAHIADMARSMGCTGVRIEDPDELRAAVDQAFATQGPVVIEVISANQLPWSEMHPTGWWDVPIPAYHTTRRETYVERRGF